jgi:hypothetical protein
MQRLPSDPRHKAGFFLALAQKILVRLFIVAFLMVYLLLFETWIFGTAHTRYPLVILLHWIDPQTFKRTPV